MILSVLIPAHNEADSIASTLRAVAGALEGDGIEHEILVVDDGSTDGTAEVVEEVSREHPTVRCHRSQDPPGFGFAVRAGLDVYRGDAVAIVMADLSDDPEDVIRYHRLLEDGFDCVFGSRFVPGAREAIVRGYSYATLPISWTNRAAGESKLSLQEMGSRYLFIVLYVFLEHHLSRGDYHIAGKVPLGGRVRPRPWQSSRSESQDR